MNKNLIPTWGTLLLIAGAVLLPIAIAVIWGVSALVGAMGDSRGGGVMKYIALGVAILWVVDLILLLLVQAVNSLTDTDGPTES